MICIQHGRLYPAETERDVQETCIGMAGYEEDGNFTIEQSTEQIYRVEDSSPAGLNSMLEFYIHGSYIMMSYNL